MTSSSPSIALMVATHNRQSILEVVDLMNRFGIDRKDPLVQFAQILGLSDNLTIALGKLGYNSNKLILFGEFDELMPWIFRRLDENKVRVISDCLDYL
jgi:proline dehydrogenase